MVETRLSAIRNDDRGATSQSQTNGNNQSDHSLTKGACLCTLLVLPSLLFCLIFEPQVPADTAGDAGVLVFPHSCTDKSFFSVFSTVYRLAWLGLFGLVC